MGTPALVFSFESVRDHAAAAIDCGYEVMTCSEFVRRKSALPRRGLVNRVDIDCDYVKAARLAEIFGGAGIKATFFVRLHADEYNALSLDGLRILCAMRDAGHEIGLHTETMDAAAASGCDPEAILRNDIATLERAIDVTIAGTACHNGETGINNLDFWRDRRPRDFGLLYEAYDREPEFNLFHEALYISDSEWTRWKCYDRGILRDGDRRNPTEHMRQDSPPLIYLLTHPDTYY